MARRLAYPWHELKPDGFAPLTLSFPDSIVAHHARNSALLYTARRSFLIDTRIEPAENGSYNLTISPKETK